MAADVGGGAVDPGDVGALRLLSLGQFARDQLDCMEVAIDLFDESGGRRAAVLLVVGGAALRMPPTGIRATM